MAGDERLGRGRECYQRRAWREAWELLSACDSESPLQEPDLEMLAVASFLLGQDGTSDGAWTRAHQRHLQTGNRPGAVRCAFWLAFRLLNGGDLPSASGWIARIERLLREAPDDSPERGQLTYLTGLLAAFSGDLATAEADLGRSGQIAERCGELDLSTLARLALGRVLIFRGDVSGGVRLLEACPRTAASSRDGGTSRRGRSSSGSPTTPSDIRSATRTTSRRVTPRCTTPAPGSSSSVPPTRLGQPSVS